MIVKTRDMDPIPPNSNPFEHDPYNMGTKIGKDLMMMHGNHPHNAMSYFILVDTVSGERIRVDIYTDKVYREEDEAQRTDFADIMRLAKEEKENFGS